MVCLPQQTADALSTSMFYTLEDWDIAFYHYQQAAMAFDDHIRLSLVLTSVGFVEKK